jgi:hypothetical protein
MKHKNKFYFYIAIFLILILIYFNFNFNFKFSNYKEKFTSKEFREKHPDPLLPGFTKDDDHMWGGGNGAGGSGGGSIYESTDKDTPTDCVRKCALTPTCQVADYDGDIAKCRHWGSYNYKGTTLNAYQSLYSQKYMAWTKASGYVYPTPTAPSGWTVEKDMDYPGNNLGSIVASPTPETCTALCSPNILCKGVGWDAENGACYLKSALVNKAGDAKYYFFKKPDPLPAIEAPSGWSRELSVDYPGNDIKSIQNSTPTNCVESCKSTSGCKGFVFESNTNTCYLKSLLTTSKKNTTANYYAYKDQLDAATPLPTGWKYEEQTDYPGNDITPVLGLTPIQCINSCPKNDGPCKGVVYDSYNEICYKKSRF